MRRLLRNRAADGFGYIRNAQRQAETFAIIPFLILLTLDTSIVHPLLLYHISTTAALIEATTTPIWGVEDHPEISKLL